MPEAVGEQACSLESGKASRTPTSCHTWELLAQLCRGANPKFVKMGVLYPLPICLAVAWAGMNRPLPHHQHLRKVEELTLRSHEQESCSCSRSHQLEHSLEQVLHLSWATQ